MTVRAKRPRTSAFAVFRNRSFALLWTAQFISSMGTALHTLAASMLVYRLTNSALSVGLMLVSTVLPTLMIGLIAGVFVDRWDRKRIMIGADLIRAFLMLLIPFLLPSGIGWLYIMVALSSVMAQFFEPAQASILPEVIRDEELAAASSLMTISTIGSRIVGYAAAGLIASTASLNWAFYLDALTFMISASCISRLHLSPVTTHERTSIAVVARNLRSGLSFIRMTTSLRALWLVFVPAFMVLGFNKAVNLPFALGALGATEFQYSVIEGTAMVGFVLASLFMASRGNRLHEGQWIALSFLGTGLAGILYALSPSVGIGILMYSLITFANAPSYIARQILIQRQTPRNMRGRVNSAFLVTRDSAYIVGMAAVGLADLVNIRLLIVLVSLVLVGSALAGFRLPGLSQPRTEWQRVLTRLRREPIPALGPSRSATLFDWQQLVEQLPVLGNVHGTERQQIIAAASIYDVATGTAILRQGERSDAVYFIVHGQVVAGREEQGANQTLEVLNAGDVIGEIAALTSVPRTATVVAEQPTTVLGVPAPTFQRLMNDATINRFLLSLMTTRMVRMNMLALPDSVTMDQLSLRELRTAAVKSMP